MPKMKFVRTEEIEIDLPIDGAIHVVDAEAWANQPYDGTTMLEAALSAELNSGVRVGPWKLEAVADAPLLDNPFKALKPPPRRRGRRPSEPQHTSDAPPASEQQQPAEAAS